MHASLWFFTLLPVAWGLQIPMVDSEATAGAGTWSYENCGTEIDAFQPKSIEVSPALLTPGATHNITIKGTATEEIAEGAYAEAVLKLGMIKLISKTFDICQVFRERNTTVQCPIQRGEFELVDQFELPKEVPPGKFVGSIQGYSASDDEILCAKFTVDFTSRIPRAEL
ncbi:Phosphatidylglycerol/phosphatidylinositol transfer protein [Penicillium angulare]|uniref:Phosphatidylglycerol/phosphatidylinositol transfer protein n=1 Tax=Penicillium angulare TaxID=116970 RepID=A0A9W9K0R2_9EURO|nr:Phosphatidylglycerol/phosphatidylinositol transfer protein [Penicillium angulare]